MSKCKRNILVATHPRSGTHFCINSLCLNLENVEFSAIRAQYPSLERLIHDHDEAYTSRWEEYLHDSNSIKVFKTHMTPTDISLALNDKNILNTRDRRIIQEVYENSQIIYLYRDGRDTLFSWYHYMKYSGGGLPIDLPPRINQCSFSEFIRMPNRYFPPVRSIEVIDDNRIKYWDHHVNDWLEHKDVILAAYESLSKDFDATIRKLAASLDMNDLLLSNLQKPPFIRVAGNNIFQKVVAQAKRSLTGVYHKKIRGIKYYPPSPAYTRKGVVGDSQDNMNADDVAFFEKHAGETMSKLGYVMPD